MWSHTWVDRQVIAFRESKMTLKELLSLIQNTPNQIEFASVISTIDNLYDYTPTAFKNGSINNAAGANEGSCKIFAFAKRESLSKEQTLALFGNYYRIDVLKNPEGSDHANIRNFILSGWEGVEFESEALKPKYP